MPSTWLAALLFAVLVAPGILFDRLSERRRAGAGESAFREAGRVTLASLLLSGSIFALLSGIDAGRNFVVPDGGRALAGGASYVSSHYVLVVRWVTIQVLASLVLAVIVHRILCILQGGATIRQVSAWTQLFKVNPPKGTRPHARIRTSGGKIYAGFVLHATPDLETDKREIVLVEPMVRAGGKLVSAPERYKRLWIRGDLIESMLVSWETTPEGESGGKRRRRSRPRTVRGIVEWFLLG